MTLCVSKLEVIHDETWLRRPIDVECSLQPIDHDLECRPRRWGKVDIGLIDTRGLVSKAKPRVVGIGHVLGRVIATELIIGATVSGTQEERLELRGIRLDAKGDSDEAPCELWGARTGKAG
jgi:hypothetical protein